LTTGTTVTYLLPVTRAGALSGIVASPYRGRVMVQLSPSNDTALARDVPSANSATETATWGATVTVNAAVPVRPALAALASVDYQMAGFRGAVEQAARLWYNAPDPETGAIAISNWVATHIAYNYQEDRQISGSHDRWYIGATVDQTWSTRSGVCENYAQVLAAMLRSLGIRCILEDGQASTGYVSSWTLQLVYTLRTTGKNHAWVEVEGVSPHAVATDPTWNGGSPPTLSAARVLTSSYTTDTQLFKKTHHPAGIEMSGAVFP
jgi:transglutaminase-like putative cysteine protease